jgi:hypothetical protein
VIQSFADAWQRVSAQVDQVRQQLAGSATTDTAQWHGAAGDRYRAHAAGTTAALGRIVELATAASSATTTMGQATASGRQQAGDLLTDLVQRLISFATQAIAAEGGITSNVLAQSTNMINTYTSPISTIDQRVRQAVSAIAPLLTALAGAMNGAPTTTAAAHQQTTPTPTPAGVRVAALEPVAAPETTRGLVAAATVRAPGRKKLAQADDLDDRLLDSPRGNTTIHLPDGKTIRVKPGGQYQIPPGSRVIRNGMEIMDEAVYPRGSRFIDGTRIRRVPDVPAW